MKKKNIPIPKRLSPEAEYRLQQKKFRERFPDIFRRYEVTNPTEWPL